MEKKLIDQKTVDTQNSAKEMQSFPVNVPVEKVDMNKWVSEMTDADYVSYSRAHKMMSSFSKDGVLYMKNLENIGLNSLIQRYELKHRSPSHVQFYSSNTTAYVMRWFPAQVSVAWEMQVNKVSDDTCDLTCLVGIDFPGALLKAAWASGLGAYFLERHLNEEGENFAKDLEKKFGT